MNTLLFLFFTLIVYILCDFIRKNINFNIKKKKVPSIQNLALPIIGHIYVLFGGIPNRKIKELSEKYGGLFSMWIGDNYTIIVSDPFYINEFWGSKNFEKFLNRPHFKTFEIFSDNYRNLSFCNDETWKKIRKLVAGFFTKIKNKNYIPIIEFETNLFLKSMKEHYENNEPFNPKLYCHRYGLNIISDISYGKKVNNGDESVYEGGMKLFEDSKKIMFSKLGGSLVEDSIWFQKFFYKWTMKEYKESFKPIKSYLKDIYDQHIENLNENEPKDLMDLLIIGTNYDEVQVISQMVDFITAGSDTTTVTVEWFLLFMANNKEIQEKAYQEIIAQFGNDCKFVPYLETSKIPYVLACIREVSRLKPTTSLGLPRVALEDTVVNGYFIPKGTHLIQNIYGMGTSQRYLIDPDVYRPERWIDYYETKELHKRDDFIEKEGDNYFNDLDKISIPFGEGQRSCVAKNLGLMEVTTLCSNILLNFIVEPWNGKQLDEFEDFGITIHPKKNLLKLIPRKN